MAHSAARAKLATTAGISTVDSARGSDTGTKPLPVKVWPLAARAVEDTGARPSGWNITCEMRPTCQSCAAILPPSACTASVTRFHAATCSPAVDAGCVQIALTLGADLRAFADDQAGRGALPVILHRHLAGQKPLGTAARQRRHDDAIGQGQGTELNGVKEIGHELENFVGTGLERRQA